jgi:hypothetical protein
MADSIVDRLEQANVRIEKLIWIPGAVAAMSVPEALKELITDELYNGDNAQIIAKLPRLAGILSSDDEPDEDWINEVLYPASGFFAQMSRPIPTDFLSETSHGFSWGYYQTKWIHVDDMEELTSLAEAFSEDVGKRAYRKSQSAA